MSKKHIFLSIFSKITIFACVFCVFSACADTTTCDIDFTPVTGNSWQNGTPTPTSPVEIKSIGTKVGNKYAVQVAVNNGGGVVDLGTLNWVYNTTWHLFTVTISDTVSGSPNTNFYINGYTSVTEHPSTMEDNTATIRNNILYIKNTQYTTAEQFKQAMSGVMLYYQRTTDETWTAPTLKTVYLDEPLRKVGEYADVLDYKNGTITRNVGVKVLDGTENWLKGSSAVANNSYYIPLRDSVDYHNPMACSHLLATTDYPGVTERQGKAFIGRQTTYPLCCLGLTDKFADTTALQTWLASQYANGTPVTVYYPLATPVVEQIENWSCVPPITDIKIATTKMVDEEFAQAEANLAATVQTIESVVSRTIAQTGQIQVLQDTKQTRPDESCPANMKCLLVQDEDGTPHWYPIIEP